MLAECNFSNQITMRNKRGTKNHDDDIWPAHPCTNIPKKKKKNEKKKEKHEKSSGSCAPIFTRYLSL